MKYGLLIRAALADGSFEGREAPHVYLSYASGSETPEQVYGRSRLGRLKVLKDRYDPLNMFRFFPFDMSKFLVVVGATGTQGRAVVKHFQANEPTWRIRGLTRDPTSPTAVKLSSSGVQLVKADLDDPNTLRYAFQDANYIYAYTDFGGITKSPKVMGKFMAGEISGPIGRKSLKIEVRHGKNIADAAATIPTLARLIWSSLASASKWSQGKYTHVYNLDSKAVVMEYMLSLVGLRSKVSGIQLAMFVENFFGELDIFQSRVDEQLATWKNALPTNVKRPWVDVEKDLGTYVEALIECPAPLEVIGVSEWKTPSEWMETWSKATGVPSRYKQTSTDNPIVDDPAGFKLTLQQLEQFMVEFGYTGGDPGVLTPEDISSDLILSSARIDLTSSRQLAKKGCRLQLTPVDDYISQADWPSIVS